MIHSVETPLNSDFAKKPWLAIASEITARLSGPRGMLGDEERQCLYWLARNTFKKQGCIVDAGAFIGASAFCLTEGLAQAGYSNSSVPLVHSFDYFAAIDDYVIEAIGEIRPIRSGDSYIDIFNAQTAPHSRLIKTYPGDFLYHKWSGDPIEILFIDIAKTQELNGHIVREFFPCLIPQQSFVIQQDFYHIWHPYIHVAMEYLRDYFEILDHHIRHQSRLYRLVRPIPTNEIERIAKYDFTLGQRAALLQRSAAASPSPTKEMLEAILVYDALLAEDKAAYAAAYSLFERRHPDWRSQYELWAVQLGQVDSKRPPGAV